MGQGQLALLATLLLAAGLFGGSSRYDAMQNVLMQPLAWLVAGFAIVLGGWRGAWRDLRAPLVLLLSLAVLTLLQLVPLGHDLWTSLPGRGPLADIASAIGSEGARPLSMVPSRTLNALSAMGIPLAALLLMGAIGRGAAYPLLVGIVVLAALNLVLAILQVASGYADATYFYAITNEGAPVGMFANRNHSAVFGALAMLVIAFLVTRRECRGFPGANVLLWSIYAAVFLTLLVNGSRAGMLTAGIALGATALLLLGSTDEGARDRSAGRARLVRYLPVAVILAFTAGLVALFLMADRLTAFQRMVDVNLLEDMRFQVLPVLNEMIGAYFPAGTGLGAFETVYRIHETPDLLGPRYLNMAHNDWLQWVIETGVVGIVLLLAFLVWLGQRLIQLAKRGRDFVVFGVAVIAILALASYFDYPLRTPIFQVIGVWLVCSLALLGRAEESRGQNVANAPA
ncbi:O-antigen ligase family protein [Aurantiacibacter poecillastricola]|uniref:O-antigen ligase family protein n=1 Tax=Aurantiacibacter poecillastricola TaxID=3064385 RepID=UPI00273D4763|nr:O-antigen ligase family protein [Aurantiacibacter sp. 219JJ12-13]MDP5260011.1 O-antigen ligase family protein [Aurantiacibacter sp. 219JJ12-13]